MLEITGNPQLAKVIEEIRLDMESFATGFAKRLKTLNEAFIKFGQTYYETAEKEYVKANGILPGSTRTRRLQKKRKKMVLNWFGQQLRLISLHRSNPVTPGERTLMEGAMFRQGQKMLRDLNLNR